jgi:hypothetical protein
VQRPGTADGIGGYGAGAIGAADAGILYPRANGATACATGNNGSLQSQSIIVPQTATAPGLNVTQSYSYDHLNRLRGAGETGGSTWTQIYGYDTLGNRWVTANTGLPDLTLETPVTQSWYSASTPNRIQSWTYENAGGSRERVLALDSRTIWWSAYCLEWQLCFS